jgi:hypothetical protein
MFGDRVLIDPDPKHEQSEGGLFIPPAVLKDNPNYYNMTGVVLQLGDGVMRHTFQCINCLALAPQDEGPCPGCHQPLGTRTRAYLKPVTAATSSASLSVNACCSIGSPVQVEIARNTPSFRFILRQGRSRALL